MRRADLSYDPTVASTSTQEFRTMDLDDGGGHQIKFFYQRSKSIYLLVFMLPLGGDTIYVHNSSSRMVQCQYLHGLCQVLDQCFLLGQWSNSACPNPNPKLL